MKWLLACALGVLAHGQQGAYWKLNGPNGEFLLQSYNEISVELLTGHIQISGFPVQLFWKDAGLSSVANKIDGFVDKDLKTGEYFLKTAEISGNASLRLSSDDAYSFFAQKAQAAGVKPPEPDPTKYLLSFSSNSFTYSGSYEIGSMVIPTNFDGKAFIHGIEAVQQENKSLTRVYDVNSELHGASGTVEFFTHANTDDSPLRKGTFMGPVTFTFTRTSTLEGKPEPPIKVNGQADRIDLDFVSTPHTMVLTGNVHVDGEMTGYAGSSSAAKAVLVFGPHNQLQEIRMEGSPTETNIKPQKPGGGGR